MTDPREIFRPLIELRERLGLEEGNHDFRKESVLEKLEDEGIEIGADEIDKYYDKTIGRFRIGGKIVIIYIKDTRKPRDYLLNPELRRLERNRRKDKQPKFHFNRCQTLQHMEEENRYNRYVLAKGRDGFFTVHAKDINGQAYELKEKVKLYVCRYCLSEEDYNGYRASDSEQRTNIVKDFYLESFLEQEEAIHAH